MTQLTEQEQKQRLQEAIETTNYIVKESKKREHDLAVKTTVNVWSKLQQIEEKNRCVRVRFLDWLSAKLLAWSQKAHEMSVKIDNPCSIKLPEKK